MLTKLILLFLINTLLVFSQTLAPVDYPHYEGYYGVNIIQGNLFKHFDYFELSIDTTNPTSPQIICEAWFSTDTSLTRIDSECYFSVKRFMISKDSISFVTESCLGESYEFTGYFLGVPSEFLEHSDDPVIEGFLTHRKNNKIIKRGLVRINWDPGC